MASRKNTLLEQPLRSLLDYREQPGTYKVDDLIEALTERSAEEISTLSMTEQLEREQFIGELSERLHIIWMQMFLQERQDKEFRLVDIASWAANNLSFQVIEDDAESHRLMAQQFLWTFAGLLEDFTDKGFLTQVGEPLSMFSRVYKVVIEDNNPLTNRLEKPPETPKIKGKSGGFLSYIQEIAYGLRKSM